MCDLTVLDLEGNSINHFTQWDSNLKIVIEGAKFSNLTQVHFYNRNNNSAYVAKTKLLDDWKIQTEVPNILLTESIPIMVFVYEPTDEKTGRSILHTRIPVIKKLKPDNFEYENNSVIIDLFSLSNRLEKLYNEVSLSEETRIANESTRLEKEKNRESAEAVRVSNENIRIENENKRIQFSEELVTKIDSLNEGIENIKKLSKVANNLTVVEEGYVLDARQGKVLNDKITSLDNKLIQYIDGDVTSEDIDNIVI